MVQSFARSRESEGPKAVRGRTRPSLELPAGVTAATTATAIAATAATGRLGTGFIHTHGASVELSAVQLGNSGFGIALLGHFDEGKAAGLSGSAIGYDVDAFDGAVRPECGIELVLCCFITQVSDKDVGHVTEIPLREIS